MIHATAQIHPSAEIDPTVDIGPYTIIAAGVKIGPHTRLWAHVNILADVVIGAWCSIGAGSEVGRGTTIGDRTRIGSQVFLPANTQIGKWVFIGPQVGCSDDRTPRVPAPTDPHYTAEPPVIEDASSIGLGAKLCPGIRIGMGARVALGAIVTHDVAPSEKVRSHGVAARAFETSDAAKAGGW
ncbi:MAG TPA: DapH/DapD/GlmU-related protein [Thermoanaerobaculia bacterium]